MDALLDFASGPLFRFSFVVLILGLLRVFFLSVLGVFVMMRRSGDRNLPWRDLFATTMRWLVPVERLHRRRPAYSFASVIFHAGLILVPLFYSAHVILWEKSTGLSWGFWMPQSLAHTLTALTMVAGAYMLVMRFVNPDARHTSTTVDYLYIVLILVPFATGLLMTQGALNPALYQWTQLTHLLSANLLMMLVPFTKIAHAALFPVGRYVAAAAWKFPAGAGDRVAATLGRTQMREEVQR